MPPGKAHGRPWGFKSAKYHSFDPITLSVLTGGNLRLKDTSIHGNHFMDKMEH